MRQRTNSHAVQHPLLALVRQTQHRLEAGAALSPVSAGVPLSEPISGGTDDFRDMLAGIQSVLTVLGWPSPDVAARSSRQIAHWLVGLELLLEVSTEMPLEVPLEMPLELQHPQYRDLSARRAGQKLRLLCCARMEAAVAQLPRIPSPSAASPASGSCPDPDLVDDRREDALSALREAMGRLSLLRAALPGIFEAEGGAASPFSSQLQAAVALARQQRVDARFARQGAVLQPEIADELTLCFQQELSATLMPLRQAWAALGETEGLRYLCGWHCAWISRLTTAALASGDWTCHDLLSSLGLLLLWLFERSEPLHQQELALFMEVCDAALGRNAGTDFEDLEARLAGALVVRELGADSENAIRLQLPGKASETLAEVAASQVPVYLARNIRRLLTACRDMEAGFRQPAFVELNRQLLVELRMLATGARALRVYRVEALSRVLADVHELLDRQEGRQINDASMALLMEGHARLCNSLNCAAAHQDVPDSRDLIARLYSWLDAHAGAADNVLTEHRIKAAGARCSQEEIELRGSFLREAAELMERIEQSTTSAALLSLLHTLKGSALQFDCLEIGKTCHGFEQLLLRQPSPPRDALPDDAAAYVCRLRGLVDDMASLAGFTETAASAPVAVPLPAGNEHSLPVPAQSLERIATLVDRTRGCNRAMQDLLAGLNIGNDNASRLLLLRDLLDEQQRHAVQLGEEIAGSRLIRFDRLTPRLQRLVARHANLLDRQVRLRVRDEELQVDRLLLERLVAPVEHLLRNAIDHGIESVEERRAASKPDCGLITLTATRRPGLPEQAHCLSILLTDDGRGIAPGREVREDGKGEPRLQHIFDAGFSTRPQATTRSGHGLGLAAVRDAITALGGDIRVSSTPGADTCFHITLPV